MNLQFEKDNKVYSVSKQGDNLEITMNDDLYAIVNYLGDFLVKRKFYKDEHILIDTSFLDMINTNRYLVVNIEGQHYKANLKELTDIDMTLSDYIVDKKKLKPIKITIDNNKQIQ
jgi:hypothetical protein